MSHVILSRAFTEVVPFEQVASHLRVWDEEDRAYIESLVDAAVCTAESYMNRLIIESVVLVGLSNFNQTLPLGRAKEIKEITYRLASLDVKVTLSPEDYELDLLRNRIVLRRGVSIAGAYDIQVTLVTGWSADEIPANVKHAVLMLVATLYEMREDATVGQGVTVTKVPVTHRYLLNKHKIYSV
ncbi:TPA: phage gp6-like head-tail connector protein [Vibrio parahaemolyticus]|nr:phage gp6-like head-tail connector protein [Vibrio parahaemolyticus]